MGLAADLSLLIGTWFGTGDGPESGPFVARIAIGMLPNGGVSIDDEATSPELGVQHVEHTLLVPGPDERDRLYVAHSESPFVTEMVAAGERAVRPAGALRSVRDVGRDRAPLARPPDVRVAVGRGRR